MNFSEFLQTGSATKPKKTGSFATFLQEKTQEEAAKPVSKSPFNPNTPGHDEFMTQLDQKMPKTGFLANTWNFTKALPGAGKDTVVGLAKGLAKPFVELGVSAVNQAQNVGTVYKAIKDKKGFNEPLDPTIYKDYSERAINVPLYGKAEPALTGKETPLQAVKKTTGLALEIAPYFLAMPELKSEVSILKTIGSKSLSEITKDEAIAFTKAYAKKLLVSSATLGTMFGTGQSLREDASAKQTVKNILNSTKTVAFMEMTLTPVLGAIFSRGKAAKSKMTVNEAVSDAHLSEVDTPALPPKVNFEDAKNMSPRVLQEEYTPVVENGKVNYELKQLPQAPEMPQLEAPKEGQPVEGPGFTMTEKADKAKIEYMKTLDEYKTSIKKFNSNPTERNLNKVLKLRDQMTELRTPSTPEAVAPELPDLAKKLEKAPKLSMSTDELSSAKNSLSTIPVGEKPGRVDAMKAELQSGEVQPVQVRQLEDGSLFIEDGRARIEAARQLGIKDLPVVDVSSLYGEKPVKPNVKVETPQIRPKAAQEATIREDKTEGTNIPSSSEGRSLVGKNIEQKAIEQKLTEGLGETAEYTKIKVKEQAEKATSLVNDSPDLMMEILRGQKELPTDLRAAAFIKAVEEHALRTKNVDLLRELANSKLTSETSLHAQELRLLAERDKGSAIAKIKEIQKAREEAAMNRKKLTKTKVRDAIQKEIDKKVTKVKTWEDFIESIKCK